jgi:hypothetical protein
MRRPDSWEYRGRRIVGPKNEALGVEVTMNGRPFTPRRSQWLRNHSPDGFEWGYSGSGPSQLALALLFDVTGSAQLSLAYYQDFKRHKVAGWHRDQWTITAGEVRAWLDEEIGRRLRSRDYVPSIEEAQLRPDAFVQGMVEGGAT